METREELLQIELGAVRRWPARRQGRVRCAVGFRRDGRDLAVSLALSPPQARAVEGGSSSGVYGWIPALARLVGARLDRVVITAWRRPSGRARLDIRWAARVLGIGSGAGFAVAVAARSGAPVFVRREILDRYWSAPGLADESRLRGVSSDRVLKAMAEVPRHEFVPEEVRHRSYEDAALPIGEDQTVSQPSLVARMTELLEPAPAHRVLEVGSGSGYQAAILSRLVAHVYTVEMIASLAGEAAARLREMGCSNVSVRQGDGYAGWPENAPYDGVIVTCAAPHVPAPLVAQLKEGGRLVIPVRRPHGHEDLMLVRKLAGGGTEETKIMEVWFVPMRGRHGLAASP